MIRSGIYSFLHALLSPSVENQPFTHTLRRQWPSFVFGFTSTISAVRRRTWDERIRCSSISLRLICNSSLCPIPPSYSIRKPRHQEFTNLGHTPHEVNSSTCGRILGVQPELVESHLVHNNIVAAIEMAIGQTTEHMACDLLFENVVPGHQICTL